MAKVMVSENFRIWVADKPGAASRPVNYQKGMVVNDVPEDVAESWVGKGLVTRTDVPIGQEPDEAEDTAKVAEPNE